MTDETRHNLKAIEKSVTEAQLDEGIRDIKITELIDHVGSYVVPRR